MRRGTNFPPGERTGDPHGRRSATFSDATGVLYALLGSGFIEEARAWRDWLVRAAAGSPRDLQIMYGVAGERRLSEQVLDWLPGYAHARPVRVGNAAVGQLQLDVYGEVIDALHQAWRRGLEAYRSVWRRALRAASR